MFMDVYGCLWFNPLMVIFGAGLFEKLSLHDMKFTAWGIDIPCSLAILVHFHWLWKNFRA